MAKRILEIIVGVLKIGIITTIIYVSFSALLIAISPKIKKNVKTDDDE